MSGVYFCAIVVLIFSSVMCAQSSIQFSVHKQYPKLKGGFEYSDPMVLPSLVYKLGFSKCHDSSHVGYFIGMSYGRKSFINAYPRVMDCSNQDSIIACITPNHYPQGYNFAYTELFLGGVFRIRRIIEFQAGPYFSYNSAKPTGTYPNFVIIPSWYAPNLLEDLYKRFEWGGQVQLNLNLPIGKHFSLFVNGCAGTSFNDLRKDKWKDAKATMNLGIGPEPNYFKMESTKVSVRYYSFGGGLKYTW
jgi:hypothetical protein